MVFGSSNKDKDIKEHPEVAHIPPAVSDLHCSMNDLPGYRITKVLGAVYGITVRSRNIAAGITMVIKSMAGGELSWFTSMLYNCRNDSISRLVEETRSRGGNAVIAMRFDAADLGGFAQTAAYGTACVVERVEGSGVEAPQLVAA